MEKFCQKIVMIAIIMILCCACEVNPKYTQLVVLEDIKCLSISIDYLYQQKYDFLPYEIAELLHMINTIPEDSKTPIQDYNSAVNDVSSDCYLHITLEQDNGNLQLLNLYCVTKEDGIIRIINHSSDDIQTESSTFEFKAKVLIDQMQKIHLFIEDEIILS